MEILIHKSQADTLLNKGFSIFGIGNKTQEVKAIDDFVIVDGQKLPLSEFKHLKDNFYYVPRENKLVRAALFSDETGLYYKLIPTIDWPTFTLSSTPMHRHTHISPKKDTFSKISALKPFKGRVLDTCCGLGYTATVSARYAKEVYTFERDKNVIELCRVNPYSSELFENSKIILKEESILDNIGKFKDNFFNIIIHDPPTFKYSPILYSEDFYAQLKRVLKKGGKMYHYAPFVDKTKGKDFPKRIARHLKNSGFKNITFDEKSSGILAMK